MHGSKPACDRFCTHLKMKRILSILLCVFLIGSIAACSAEDKMSSGEADDGKLTVITTIFPQYDFSREVGGDKLNLSMLLPPGSESHSYEPSPQDIIGIGECDVFIYVGGESESWVRTILNSMDTSNMTILSLMDMVDAVEEELVEGMEHEHEEDHDHEDGHSHAEGEEHAHEEGEPEEAEYDEHVWTSPVNAMKITGQISETFQELDPQNAGFYQENADNYVKELEALDAQFCEITDGAVRKTLVFGDRFPFRYFADEYGLDYYAAFPGCSSDSEPSTQTVAFLIDMIKEEEIPVVFHIEFSNGRMADTISDSTGAKKLQLHSCHNVSRDDINNGVNYLDLMGQNAVNLKEALY